MKNRRLKWCPNDLRRVKRRKRKSQGKRKRKKKSKLKTSLISADSERLQPEEQEMCNPVTYLMIVVRNKAVEMEKSKRASW